MSAASVRWRRWGGSSLRKGLSSGSASSRASSGGMASWRVSSSVSSCPVTRARRVRGASPSSTWALAPEQVECGEVGGGLAVRRGGALQHQPPLRRGWDPSGCNRSRGAISPPPRPRAPLPARGRPPPGQGRPRAASSMSRPTKRVSPGPPRPEGGAVARSPRPGQRPPPAP